MFTPDLVALCVKSMARALQGTVADITVLSSDGTVFSPVVIGRFSSYGLHVTNALTAGYGRTT